MQDILDRFEKKYAHLKKKGLRIEGLAEIDSIRKYKVIKVSKPFIFDNRLIPDKFEGVKLQKRISGDLPNEFKTDQERFIWSPDRYERFVDRCGDEIRKKLGLDTMSREEMLDAMCGGNYQAHVEKVTQWAKEGRIPPLN
ncbi:MAG: hypothetical protein HYZ16_11545 [Bacteroidetes bacterium]|jgi:hypothetical protein|nr:hypothetical protein [Bacteroidota bacterium]